MKQWRMLMRQTSQAYAKAAFNQALQDNCLDAWYKLILCLSEIKHPVLKNPHLTESSMISAIDSGIKLTETQERWVRLLVNHRHIHLLPRICEQFIKHYRKAKKIRTIFIKTARELSSKEQESIKANLVKQKSAVMFSVDSSIVGGVQIEHNGVLIDHSYANILNQLYRKK